jgi:serine/threonine-protein kinase
LARFEREAKLLASLNHPNIAAIYGFEEADDVRFLAMELVEGENLAERVARGAVPVEEALEICRQIAEGVEAAHEKGVIHRDLKPANVKVTPEGKVKILDFGLAKAFEDEIPAADISQSPTLTEEMTRAGVILGTAAYMSPEQAKGKPVDKRADIFAFGAVLYELLTGKRAFEGETITETLGAILHKEPEWATLPESTPSIIQVLLRQCLQKQPDERLRDIGDFQALSKAAAIEPVGRISPGQPPLWKSLIPWSIAVVAVVLAALALWSVTRTPTSPMRLAITFPTDEPLANTPYNEIAISPDGTRIVYVSNNHLYVRSMDKLEATPIPGTEGAVQPFFSPDGQAVAFFAGGNLKRIELSAETPVTICEVDGLSLSGHWSPEGMIVFSSGSFGSAALYSVSAAGGTPKLLLAPDQDTNDNYRFPEVLPGGKAILYSIFQALTRSPRIGVLSLETGETSTLLEGAREPHYLPTGHLLYQQGGGTLMSVRFDLTNLEASGEPTPILPGVRTVDLGSTDYTVSGNGVLAYVPGQSNLDYSLVWVDRDGRETEVTARRDNYAIPRISPDGKRVALVILPASGLGHVWVYDLQSDSFSRLISGDQTPTGAGLWSPDGKWIAFLSSGNVYRQLADRSRPPELLVDQGGCAPSSWSPDGSAITGECSTPNYNISIIRLNGEESALTDSPRHESSPRFSPDGRWLAYVSDERGHFDVYVRPFPEFDVPFLISEDEGGTQPVWSPDGTELFYRIGNKMMVVPVSPRPSFTSGKPQVLFEGSYRSSGINPAYQYYDISPDGSRFLMIKEEHANQINVVLNWFEELERLVPTN